MLMKSQRHMRLFTLPRVTMALCVLIVSAMSLFFYSASPARAASYCQVSYTVTSQWPGGFGANLTVQNTGGTAWSSWNLTFAFPAIGQAVSQGWNGMFSQSGQDV